jgi:hypothetical protein
MPTVSNAARITSKDGAIWRTCGGCGALAALPPDINLCAGCQPGTDAQSVQLRAEHFAPGDLADISLAGCVFAAAIADIAHHEIRDPRSWDCLRHPARGAGPAAQRARPHDCRDQGDLRTARRG